MDAEFHPAVGDNVENQYRDRESDALVGNGEKLTVIAVGRTIKTKKLVAIVENEIGITNQRSCATLKPWTDR